MSGLVSRTARVPHTDLAVDFDAAFDMVVIRNDGNGTFVEMSHQEWSWLVERARYIRGEAR